MKYFKLKFLLIFAALAMAIPPAWAGTETVVFSQQGYDNGEEVTSYVGTTFSLSFDKGDNTATPKYYDTGTGVRLYRSNNMTVSSSKTITKIELSFGSGDGTNAITTDVGTYSNGTWNGSATTVLFTVGGTSGHRRLSAVTVTTKDSGDPSISFEPNPLPINDNGGTFTVSGSNLPTNGLGVKFENSQLTDFSFNLDNGDNTYHYFPVTNGSLEGGIVSINYNGRALSATAMMNFESGSANETETINYRSDIYIVTDNGVTNDWHFERGVKMDYADNKYTGEFTSTNPNTFIVFARKLTESSQDKLWGTRYVFGPTSDDDWVYGDNTSGTLNLNDAKVIKFPEAGTYTITITAQDNKFSISKASEPTTYVKVTSTDQLVAGKNYIFVYDTYALGSFNNSVASPVTVTVNNDGTVEAGDDVVAFTLGSIANDNPYSTDVYYSLSLSNGDYLIPTTSTSLNSSNNDTYAKWTMIAADGGFGVRSMRSDQKRGVLCQISTHNFGHYAISNLGESYKYALLYVQDDGSTPTQTVAKPTISPASGNYKTPQSVTITCATEEAEIHYTTDGSDPTANSTLYTGAITVNTPNATTTIKAIGVKADMNSSGIATATYTLPQAVDNLAAANALAPETGNNTVDFMFTGNVVVTYAGGDYIWLRDVDATAGGGLFYQTGTEVTTPGAVLNPNWGASAKQYKGLKEFINAEGVANSSTTAAYAPFDRTGVELTDAHMNEYIVFNNVHITGWDNNKTYTASYTTDEGSKAEITYQLYDQFGKTPEVGKTYNITGLVTKFNVIQVYPTELEEVPQVATPTFSPNGGEFTAAQEVTISCATENAKIYYSLDRENWTEGTTLTVDRSGKVYAKATKANMQDSEVAEATFTINYPAITVTLEPETETYTVGDEAKVKVTVANTVGTATVTYMTGETAETANTPVTPDEDGYITIPTTEAGTVVLKVTASDAYHAEPVIKTGTYTIEAKPYVTAVPASLDFVTVIGEEPVSKTFTVMAENLKGDITLTMSESEVFTFTPATIAKADMTNDGVVVTVTYNPTAATGNDLDEATITLKTKDAEDVTVTLAGMATLPEPELNVSTEELEMGTDPTGTFTVTGQHLTEDVTLTVTEGTAANFVITPANITPDEEGKVNQEITVTYKGTSTTDELATITVASGTAKKEVTVSARVLPTPELIADPESLTMTAVVGQTPATETFTVMAEDLRGDITLTLSETDAFTINPATIAKADMTEDGVEVTVTYTPTQAGNDNATITIASEAAESVTVTLNGTATVPEVVAAPTFSLVAGSYTGAQTVTIGCATEGATILYSTDGGSTWTTGNTVNVDKDMTIMAKAEKDGYTNSATVTAAYIIDIPEELPTITPFKGYYQIKNNGNNKYANIAGRKTLNFADAENAKKMAGTVIWLETNDKGQVQSLRSQAADLQGYANRAMRYVPQMVEIVVNKINEMEGIEDATGAGSVLGETGLDAIMEKFNECFDYHLYVEQAQGGWRLYGKTPNMQHVVDFYRDHKDQVEAKLPKLEQFINDALDKLINKIGGSTALTDFSLHQIWEKMGGTLTEPVDEASIMAFYREVLNNKNYVWDFAYQTAQIYWGNVKNHPRYNELKAQLGEYADYIDEFVTQVRPDFKYYVIQRGDEPDYISEGNGEIISNQPHTIWTLEPRTDFTVNIAGEQFGCPYAGGVGGYATTLYTDFAYTLPDGVTAYKVASIDGGNATIEPLSGVIPAQTPVLLMAKDAGDYVLTLSTEAGTAVEGNLLVGPDYLIKTYELKTPMVETLFSLAKGVLGEQLYNQYVAQYEYLQLLYAGTVNNKYFWGLTRDDVMKCLNANGDDCVVRDLSGGKFIDNRQVKTNKAFLVSETDQTITISTLRGDVNHDGYVNLNDVTDLIDRLLVRPDADHLKACPYCSDVNKNNVVNIQDVTVLIDILLGNGTDSTQP